MICKNCNNNFEGKFCNECGQPAATHDMNFHFLFHDVQHGLLHLDKGFFFTIKELFKRPGYAIREYIEGKRVNHFKPISLILVLAGTFGLLSHFFHADILAFTVKDGPGDAKGLAELQEFKRVFLNINDWITDHYSLVTVLLLPIFALCTYIAFRRQGYNFVEHLVLNAYLASQRLLLHIVTLPILLLSKGPAAQKTFNDSLYLIIMIITLWTMFQFFDKLKKWSVLWRTAVGFLIATAIILALGATIVIIVLSDFKAH